MTGENHTGHARYDVSNTCLQCRLVRSGNDISRAGWGNNESGFQMANYSVNERMFVFHPLYSMEYISITINFMVDKSS